MRANYYRILEHCLEVGIAFGLRRARKYAEGAPTDDAIAEHVQREILNEISVWLDFPSEPEAAEFARDHTREEVARTRAELRDVQRELKAARRELIEARVEAELAENEPTALDWQPTDTDGVEAASCMTNDGAPFHWRIERCASGAWTNAYTDGELSAGHGFVSVLLDEVKAHCQRIEDEIAAQAAEVGP